MKDNTTAVLFFSEAVDAIPVRVSGEGKPENNSSALWNPYLEQVVTWT
ncbi:MAG: hypothetical protein ABSF46_04220 [Terriglobia bacterium]|jgi:hypothetical protein